jgi:Domain of unknown function (DUF4202)
MDDDARWRAALDRLAGHHDADPRMIERDGAVITWSRDYHARVLAWVDRLEPGAPLHVRLAAFAQHLRRWESPRAAYPAGGEGYKRWRAAAGLRQAELAVRELAALGYPAELLARMRAVMLKQRLRADPDAALLEDAVCLRFVEDELAEFARGRERDPVVRIIRKTWDKMSPRGHASALELLAADPPRVPAEVAVLVTAALQG